MIIIKNQYGRYAMQSVEEMIREFPKGLLNWYTIQKESKVLLIDSSSGPNSLEDVFVQQNCLVKHIAREMLERPQRQKNPAGQKESLVEREEETKERYDYIVMVEVLEESFDPVGLLRECRRYLKPDGRLLIGAQNRLGIRFFVGERDLFTERIFDGIDRYRRITKEDREQIRGRSYSRAELISFLEQAGFGRTEQKFYSVMPMLEKPQLIYAQDFVPTEDLSVRYFPMYHDPDTVFLDEEYILQDLIENDMFHSMANAFLIEVSPSGSFEEARQVTLSMDRGKEYDLATILYKDSVVKKPLYPEGEKRLADILEHDRYLRERGISVVDAHIEQGKYVMPYVEGEVAVQYLNRILKKDPDLFLKKMDEFYQLILQSGEVIEGKEETELGPYVKRAYIDLTPHNCFHIGDDEGGEFCFYDQEFVTEDFPIRAVVIRLVNLVFQGGMNRELVNVFSMDFFYERYQLTSKRNKLLALDAGFHEKLRHRGALDDYERQFRPDKLKSYANRQKANYSQEEYQRLFIDIFKGAENKKLVVFGSGNFGERFLAQFKEAYEIAMVIDNNANRWGKTVEGITIKDAALLSELSEAEKAELHIIICVKNYAGIVKQLEELGISNYHIYDYNIDYPIPQRSNVKMTGREAQTDKEAAVYETDCGKETDAGIISEKKLYHIGYIAGVFDLYHIGHLNLLRRAKELCDYLIVGVVSDEGVRDKKQTDPFVPFEERIQMVASCKYVDEAVKIPYTLSSTRDAYRMYHFDVQFSGSDYANDAGWLAEKKYLQDHGSDMYFFPYTESTSSTKLKKMIEQKLI